MIATIGFLCALFLTFELIVLVIAYSGNNAPIEVKKDHTIRNIIIWSVIIIFYLAFNSK